LGSKWERFQQLSYGIAIFVNTVFLFFYIKDTRPDSYPIGKSYEFQIPLAAQQRVVEVEKYNLGGSNIRVSLPYAN